MLRQSLGVALVASALAAAGPCPAGEPEAAERVRVEVQSVLDEAGLKGDALRGADPAHHLRLRLRFDKAGVRVLETRVGEGPPRTYLAEPEEVSFVLLDGTGSELHRTHLADPREVRVYATDASAVHARGPLHDRARLPVTEVEVFLPVLPGLAAVEVTDRPAGLE